jgi:signal transduction histidine kinase/ActR/RegA family two-component response regulator
MSLVTRLTLLWSLLAAALVGLFGFLSYRGSREHVLATWRETLEHDATTTILRVQSAVQEAARDALYLASTPSVREYVRAGDIRERERWRRLTEEEFRALMAGKPTYFQVRLIGAAFDGMELIRLDAAEGAIEAAAPDRLQQKGDRDYFQEGRRLRPGEVYVSDLNLNQDFGQITEPHTPTVRTVASVADADGRLFGMVVINVDLSGLVSTLPAQASPGVTLQVGNERGDYVVHPDRARVFGSDLGRADRFADGMPTRARGAAELMVERAFPVMPGLAREWRVRLTARESEFLRGLAAARNQAVALTGLAALGGLGVVLLGGRGLARRLREVSDAMARYEAGQEIPASPPPGPRDEIGQLADKFRGLATKVRDDVAKLEVARRDAEEAARARDDFLAMMSHEIRTPMNAVTGLLRVLERNRPAPHQEPVLASLRSASRQLLALLDEALDHSKIKAGKVDFHPVDFSLHELLGDVVLTHRPLAAQKGLVFEYHPAPDLPDRLRGDAVRLGQVLNNLLGNAVKFTDRGGITLVGRVLHEQVPDGGSTLIELTVTDTGIGIAGENIGRIFSPFDQEHGDIGRRFGGTGLGLSIVRSLVELQGGTLRVESHPGQGSCFRVRLPFAPAAAPALATTAAATGIPDWSGRRILYAEDVASNREVMAATLADTRVDLVMAGCGAEALRLVSRGRKFDLALIDLQLPDMNGLELAHALHALVPDLGLVAVTAQVSAETRADCLAHGLIGVVTKPFSADALIGEIGRRLPIDVPPALTGLPIGGAAGAAVTRAAMEPLEWATATAEACPTRSPADALHHLFPGEPGRVRRLLATLALEFSQHETDFAGAAAAAARADLTALRALRHKLHSALLQLHLEDLRLALDALLESPENHERRRAAASALHEAAQGLRAAAEA